MLSVSTALESLYRCLDEAFPPSPGTRIFDVPFALNDAFDPLLWCTHQPQWPQFYWQQRSGDEELAALGAVQIFASLEQAHAFLRQQGREGVDWAAAPRYAWCYIARPRSATMPVRHVNFSIRWWRNRRRLPRCPLC